MDVNHKRRSADVIPFPRIHEGHIQFLANLKTGEILMLGGAAPPPYFKITSQSAKMYMDNVFATWAWPWQVDRIEGMIRNHGYGSDVVPILDASDRCYAAEWQGYRVKENLVKCYALFVGEEITSLDTPPPPTKIIKHA
jgi:hypothetical protein